MAQYGHGHVSVLATSVGSECRKVLWELNLLLDAKYVPRAL